MTVADLLQPRSKPTMLISADFTAPGGRLIEPAIGLECTWEGGS